MEYLIHSSTCELYHHGVKGQKWGVRRYRNYDGSYTRAGVKRYDASYENMNSKKQAYKDAKKQYGGKSATTVNAKIAYKKAKRQNTKDYKHLKNDKLADQGKALYAKGIRINDRKALERSLMTIGTFTVGATYKLASSGLIDKKVSKALYAIGGMSIAGGTATAAVGLYTDRRLREYYSHTSKY